MPAFTYIYPGTIVNPRAYIISIIIAILLIFIWRVSYYLILEHGVFNQKIALMGSGDLAKNIYNEISDKRDCGYEIKLLISEIIPNQELNENNTVRTISLNDDNNLFEKEISNLGIKKIIVALKEKRNRFPLKELLRLPGWRH